MVDAEKQLGQSKLLNVDLERFHLVSDEVPFPLTPGLLDTWYLPFHDLELPATGPAHNNLSSFNQLDCSVTSSH